MVSSMQNDLDDVTIVYKYSLPTKRLEAIRRLNESIRMDFTHSHHSPSLVELVFQQNRQVFWLKHHHSPNLPGFPVAFMENYTLQRRDRAGFSPGFPFHRLRFKPAPVNYKIFNSAILYISMSSLSSFFERKY
jgi:hypothetical protein